MGDLTPLTAAVLTAYTYGHRENADADAQRVSETTDPRPTRLQASHDHSRKTV
jgi:hypothetical protein